MAIMIELNTIFDLWLRAIPGYSYQSYDIFGGVDLERSRIDEDV